MLVTAYVRFANSPAYNGWTAHFYGRCSKPAAYACVLTAVCRHLQRPHVLTFAK